MNKPIKIEFLEPEQMRYKSCGDYFEDDDCIYFQIVKQYNKYHSALILIHELVEYILTCKRGIPESAIMEYDLKWEEANSKGLTKADEPGNEDNCIYKTEHREAETIERLLALMLKQDWFQYEKDLKL